MAGSASTTVGAVGGGDLKAAAEEIAEGVRAKAAASGLLETSGRIEVSVSGSVATISCDAPSAYPNETNARHPVFAHGLDRSKWTWVAGNDRPFLGPAADERAGAAMARYARKIDRWCKARGFE